MSFIAYDLVFMIVFTLLVVLFLYIRRKNLKRQGLIYLYPTKVGINFIEEFSKKYFRTLKILQYVVVACGYFLMIGSIWLIARVAYIYISSPVAAKALKVPVLMPLVPYLPELFHISFLPPFYFAYWIIIIAVIAIPHEFAHGIFARINKIKVHSTGFGFLGPFLAAFVEPDEKKMNKSKKFPQLSILAAGTFANILVSIILVFVMWIFFMAAYHPVGVQFDSYAISAINSSNIGMINGIDVADIRNATDLLKTNESLLNITVGNQTYFISPDSVQTAVQKGQTILAYDDSPALKARLSGAIIEVNGQKINSRDEVRAIILSSKPGDNLNIKTKQGSNITDYNIKLAERDGKAFLGVAQANVQRTGAGGLIGSTILRISDPLSYEKYLNGVVYESSWGDFGIFVYYLIWWLVLVNLSVALINMVPVGIFDGGRFFYLTVWGLTKSKKIGEIAFKISTWVFLAVVAAMMLKWVFVFI